MDRTITFFALINWKYLAIEVKLLKSEQADRNAFVLASEIYFYGKGIAFSMIGNNFSARVHRYPSVLGDKGSSLYPNNSQQVVCLMNSQIGRGILQSLNPSISFQVGDVNRLPLFPIESADEIFAQLDRAFTDHEAARETSVEFQHPGPSCWAYAQAWAQQAVDRPPGAPLPPWQPTYDPVPPTHWVSYALGLALGRFPLSPGPGTSPLAPLHSMATVYTHLGPHPLSPPLPKMGEGEARQAFPAVSGSPSPVLGEGVGG